jgi:hypothetical protein
MLALWIVLAHLVGDYIIQSDWMANEKTKKWWPAVAHGISYTFPYAALNLLPDMWGEVSPTALAIIAGTHIIIDRYRLARHLAWLKNQAAPKAYRSTWKECRGTGYPADKPPFMAVWLMIIADNTVHLLINTAAILWL